MKTDGYSMGVIGLTKQEQWVVWIVVVLLLTGWATKTYRAAHPVAPKPGAGAPPTFVMQQAKP